jgi:hypothetical protein
MPDLNEANTILALAERFHDPVDAVAGEAKNHGDAPIGERVDEDV